MKIAIVNGSVRKGNSWTAINAFMQAAGEEIKALAKAL